MKKKVYYILLIMCALLVGCKDRLPENDLNILTDRTIHIGTTVSDQITVVQTRAGETTDTVRAETVDWMKGALLAGLDITYSNLKDGKHVIANQHVAILKWLGTYGTTYTVNGETVQRGNYTFKYKKTGTDAEWYDNGPHFFEGQYVPAEIRTTETTISATNLVTEQHDDADYTYDATTGAASGSIGNYTLLSHYVGMPPNWTTSATVDQVLLPFKHRLARVIAYILIDPDLMDKTGLATAKLKGYSLTRDTEGNISTPEDPTTTELRFANVKVLEKVNEVVATAGSDAAASLTPQWTLARRVIPHFEAELTQSVNNKQELAVPTTATEAEKTAAQSGFIVYTRKRDEKRIHPRDEGWYEAHKDYLQKGPNSAYTQKKYTSVPVYDVIVRPTYKTTDDVMYDEDGYYNADKTINTPAIVELAKADNSIEFEITLNNDLVYSKKFDFDLNANQQTIVYISIDREIIDYDESKSENWVSTNTTDNYYGVNNDLGHNLSMAGSSWQRAFRNSSYNPGVTDGNDYGAVENGEYVGQYVSDATWIKAFAQAYQGEGGEHHGDYFILDRDITIDARLLPDNFVFTGHLDGRGHTINVTNLNTRWSEDHYQYDEITDFSNLPGTIYEKVDENYTQFTLPTLYSANYYTQDEIDAAKAIVEADGYVQGTDPTAEEVATKTTSDIKDYSQVTPTIAEVMAGGTTYYESDGNGDYVAYSAPTALYAYVNHPITHTSGSALFAGLNGNYTTAQESNPSVTPWEANVHKEGSYWVPMAGYRAELYNTTVSGGNFFPADAVFCGSDLNRSGATVTGYIYNCFDETHTAPNNPLTNKVPIPQY